MASNHQIIADKALIKTKIVSYFVTSFLQLVCFLGGSCSESQPVQDSYSSYIPFHSQKKKQPNKKELSKLLNRKDIVFIEPGEFWMGSPMGELGRKSDELLHKVKITKGFWIKKFEVSNSEWNQFAGEGQKKGEKAFWISGKTLDQLCSSIGYQDGNYLFTDLKKEERYILHWRKFQDRISHETTSGRSATKYKMGIFKY